jgi:hypothetical protein
LVFDAWFQHGFWLVIVTTLLGIVGKLSEVGGENYVCYMGLLGLWTRKVRREKRMNPNGKLVIIPVLSQPLFFSDDVSLNKKGKKLLFFTIYIS